MTDPCHSSYRKPEFPLMPVVPGVRLGAVATDNSEHGTLDLLLVDFENAASWAGVYTRSRAKAPAVEDCIQKQQMGQDIRALVVNAGNANAMTGRRGVNAVRKICQHAANLLDCHSDQVISASTGKVGEILKVKPLLRGLDKLVEGLSASLYQDAAEALKTQDSFAKGARERVMLPDGPVDIVAIGKGSVHISPNMATVLAFIFMPLSISGDLLQQILQDAVQKTFNRLCIDGVTATNDTVLAFATQKSRYVFEDINDKKLLPIKAAITRICEDLAHQILLDKPADKRLLHLTVEGARTQDQAEALAQDILSHQTLKADLSKAVPDYHAWIALLGKAIHDIDIACVEIHIDRQCFVHKSTLHLRFDSDKAAQHLQGPEVFLRVELNQGLVSTIMHGHI